MDLAKLALTGLIGGTLGMAACAGTAEAPAELNDVVANAEKVTTEAVDKVKTEAAAVVEGAGEFSELHDCAGKNTCKGLGGCKVTAESLAAMGKKMGVEGEALGAPHDCKGHNSCKGLGGCSVDADTLAKLKAKVAGGSADH